MKKIVKYNKLIRDKIPQIIRSAGWTPKIKTLSKKEYFKELRKKVLEEAKELIQAKDGEDVINEVVDIQELIDSLLSEIHLTKLQLKKKQGVKNKKRGAFKKRLFLISEEKIIK